MKEALELRSFIPGLSDHSFLIIVMMLLDYLIVIGIVALGSIKPKMKPSGPQNLVEWAVMYICNYADDIIGKKQAPRYYWLLVSLFFYIFVGNLLGLVPGLVSPTSSLSVTVTLALGVWLYTWFEGIREKGIVKFFGHYFGGPSIPIFIKPVLFFVELLSDISRPISLSFRLFGNIMAKEILLSVLVGLVLLFWPTISKDVISAGLFTVAGVLRPLIIWLGALVSLIQAGVFTLLTATYLAGHVVSHEDEHAEEH
jgi:F-type H+-transporting ATPase subunit a